MKRFNMVLLATILLSAGCYSQKGNNAIGAGGALSLPSGEFGLYFNTGLGLYAKGMIGIGKAGQATFSTGYSSFKEKGEWEDYSTTASIIPLLFGYRHNFNGFFVEPQLGYGLYGFKYTWEEGNSSESDGAVTWGANVGYIYKQFEICANYQSGSKNGGSIGMFGLKVGYNFTLPGGDKAK